MLIIALIGIAISRSSSIPQIAATSTTEPSPWKIHVPLLLLMNLSLGAALWLTSPWFGMVATLAFVLLFARNCGDLYAVALPLFLLIPLPFAMDTDFIMRLQRVSSIGASAMLDAAGIEHLLSGNVLELPDRRLFVAEACSGIGSVFLMLATTSVYLIWKHLRVVVAIPLLCSAIVWAVAGNTLRIFLVAYSHAAGGPELSHGISHDLVGATTYCFSILMLILSEQALLFLFDPIPERRSDGQWAVEFADSARRPLIPIWNRKTSMESEFLHDLNSNKGLRGISVQPTTFIAAMLPALLAFSIANATQFWRSHASVSVASSLPVRATPHAGFSSLSDESFSNATMNPQVVAFSSETETAPGSDFPATADFKTWRLRISGIDVVATVDGPFEVWKNAVPDYTRDGWKISKRDFVEPPGTNQQSSVVARTILYRTATDREPATEHALLLFAAFGKAGAPVSAPESFASSEFAAVLNDEFASLNRSDENDIWRFQLFVQDTEELDPATQNHWNHIFTELFKTVTNRWRR